MKEMENGELEKKEKTTTTTKVRTHTVVAEFQHGNFNAIY